MPRLTKQKALLLRELFTFQSFFNAEELHRKIPGIGIATVYRFLKGLESKGNLHSFICAERKIYSQNKHNHMHFTCERCGKKQHLPLAKVDFLQQNLPGKMCHFQIDITGICDPCLTTV